MKIIIPSIALVVSMLMSSLAFAVDVKIIDGSILCSNDLNRCEEQAELINRLSNNQIIFSAKCEECDGNYKKTDGPKNKNICDMYGYAITTKITVRK